MLCIKNERRVLPFFLPILPALTWKCQNYIQLKLGWRCMWLKGYWMIFQHFLLGWISFQVKSDWNGLIYKLKKKKKKKGYKLVHWKCFSIHQYQNFHSSMWDPKYTFSFIFFLQSFKVHNGGHTIIISWRAIQVYWPLHDTPTPWHPSVLNHYDTAGSWQKGPN